MRGSLKSSQDCLPVRILDLLISSEKILKFPLLLLLEIGFQPVVPALRTSLRRPHPAILHLFGGQPGGKISCVFQLMPPWSRHSIFTSDTIVKYQVLHCHFVGHNDVTNPAGIVLFVCVVRKNRIGNNLAQSSVSYMTVGQCGVPGVPTI